MNSTPRHPPRPRHTLFCSCFPRLPAPRESPAVATPNVGLGVRQKIPSIQAAQAICKPLIRRDIRAPLPISRRRTNAGRLGEFRLDEKVVGGNIEDLHAERLAWNLGLSGQTRIILRGPFRRPLA